MKGINNYIFEKIKINKDSKVSGDYLNYPIDIDFYADWKDIGNLRDEIISYTKISYFELNKLEKSPEYINNKKVWLYSIEITTKDNLLWFLSYLYCCFSNEHKFTGKKIFKEYIKNFYNIKEYIEQFSDEEYQNRINKTIESIKLRF